MPSPTGDDDDGAWHGLQHSQRVDLNDFGYQHVHRITYARSHDGGSLLSNVSGCESTTSDRGGTRTTLCEGLSLSGSST